MPTYKYEKGSNVCHNGGCYTVFRHRDVSGAAGYLIRKVDDGTVLDNVLESNCMDCDCNAIIDLFWPNFTYLVAIVYKFSKSFFVLVRINTIDQYQTF